MSCKHEIARFELCCNEDGWVCEQCGQKMPGEPRGFRPDLDKTDIRSKVESVLITLDLSKLISIGSSSYGDGLGAAVAERCRKNNRFDQYSIILFVMEEIAPSHGEYWANISSGVLSGKDPRDRCWCGKLANTYGKNGPSCSLKHDVDFRGRVKTVRRRHRPGQEDLFIEAVDADLDDSGADDLSLTILDNLIAKPKTTSRKRRAGGENHGSV